MKCQTSPSTETIKYIGSKLRILPHILKLASKTSANTAIDGFSGSTRVSQGFAKMGYQVFSNDIAVWSEVLSTCYLLCSKKRDDYVDLIDHLNNTPPVDGWFTEHYGGSANEGSSIQADGLKRPFQIHNTRKLDGVRQEIDNLKLNDIDRAVALTSLMLSLDRVDSSIGHFSSYLSKWSSRSYNNIVLKVPRLFASRLDHKVFRMDIFDLIKDVSADLAYLDPPYGSNNDKMPPSRVRYAAYYHIWTSVCLYDKSDLFGKAKRRVDTSDRTSSSVFEDFRKDEKGNFIAVNAIEKLIRDIPVRWVILSYSSGGRATAEELFAVIERSGVLHEVVKIDYKKNVMSSMMWTNEWLRDVEDPHYEYLFLIEK